MKTTFSNRAFVVFALVILIINGVYPLLWMLFTSLKTELELTADTVPLTYFPTVPQLSNYARVFAAQPFAQYFLNSMIVAILSTALCVVLATFAAYALSRLKLASRGLISVLVVAASIFPVVSLIVPLYQAMNALGWLNTYLALIIPYAAFSLPISILTLTAFFQGIPTELEDAAMVDGCSRFGALWRIIVPLSAPGVATAAIIAFVNAWNEFLLALTFARSPNVKTIPPAIVDFQSQFGGFQWEVVSAAIIVAIIPVVVIILIFQQRIISGLTSGSVKG
ncbi:MAG: carbohydrate ABC transporter permease [Pleurocapsa sp. SU_196_0]|nr:carbohydrate ABC transporter permease [Pleurocapsa sp. SU_196_0]